MCVHGQLNSVYLNFLIIFQGFYCWTNLIIFNYPDLLIILMISHFKYSQSAVSVLTDQRILSDYFKAKFKARREKRLWNSCDHNAVRGNSSHLLHNSLAISLSFFLRRFCVKLSLEFSLKKDKTIVR